MSLGMKVDFPDTTPNWQSWGQLVELWISGMKALPKDVKGLLDQVSNQGISGASVPGAQDRNVVFYHYDEKKELVFLLPTEDMLKAARTHVTPGPYPLPVFYNDAYDGKRTDLTDPQDTLFVKCRVGEYTINNCC